MSGKLDVGDARAWWDFALERLTARNLALRPEHVAEIHTFPSLHKDPFDRALIAQAITENPTLVTSDSQIPRYASAGLKTIS